MYIIILAGTLSIYKFNYWYWAAANSYLQQVRRLWPSLVSSFCLSFCLTALDISWEGRSRRIDIVHL